MTEAPPEAVEALTLPLDLELHLVLYPDPGLKVKSIGLSEEEATMDETRKIADAMIKAMYEYKGVGLAAQQVGYPGAMFVIDTSPDRNNPRVFINPFVKGFSKEAISLTEGEGCLSTPYGFKSPVDRASEITLEWRDLDWNLHEETFTGTDSIVVQHEIDHLLGHLFIDHLSRLKQDIFKRKARKIRKKYMRAHEEYLRGRATVEKEMAKIEKERAQ